MKINSELDNKLLLMLLRKVIVSMHDYSNGSEEEKALYYFVYHLINLADLMEGNIEAVLDNQSNSGISPENHIFFLEALADLSKETDIEWN